MHKQDIVNIILQQQNKSYLNITAQDFACSNIALIKYWGKKNNILNIPNNDSLSVPLGNKGAIVSIKISNQEQYYLNSQLLDINHIFFNRLKTFLDLFRIANNYYIVDIQCNIPIAAGLASSACIFAAIIKVLAKLFAWNLNHEQLSILARLGSGSACRSIHDGFVLWQAGKDKNGMDSFATNFAPLFEDLRIGLLIIDKKPKIISSTAAMELTRQTSLFYDKWQEIVNADLAQIKHAILTIDFAKLGQIAEYNSLAMHACMLTSRPTILYSQNATIALMHKVWQLRNSGLSIFFTQDAGANLKLLFLQQDVIQIKKHFPQIEIINPHNKMIIT